MGNSNMDANELVVKVHGFSLPDTTETKPVRIGEVIDQLDLVTSAARTANVSLSLKQALLACSAIKNVVTAEGRQIVSGEIEFSNTPTTLSLRKVGPQQTK